MLITEDHTEGDFQIRAYEPGKITINQEAYEHSLIVTQHQLIKNWAPQSLTELTPDHLTCIIELNPEVVLLGTGIQFKRLTQNLLSPFYDANIGIESMDTGAACRTFAALLSEGRNVAAALLIE